MTNKFFKFVSFVTALCVLLCVMPVVVFAEDGKIYHSEEISAIRFSPETELPLDVNYSINKFFNIITQYYICSILCIVTFCVGTLRAMSVIFNVFLL